MEPSFSDFMLGKLRDLIDDLELGLQPLNIVLYEVVTRELRKQYDLERERRNART